MSKSQAGSEVPEGFEATRCCICDLNDTAPFCAGRDRLYGLGTEFRLVRCRNCGLVFLNPRPNQDSIASYYLDEEYVPYFGAVEDERSLFLRLNRRYGLMKRCRVVAKSLKPEKGKFLDVGCATGVFLDGIRGLTGWEVFGVEPNSSAAEYGRRRFGLQVFEGTLRDAAFPSEHFDAITLWHVLEHLHDPQADLLELHRILKPGGLLVLTTPNLDSLDAKLFGQYWAGLEVPRHLFDFSLSTLKRAVDKAGFEAASAKCVQGSWWAFATSLQFLAEDKLGKAPSRGRLWEGKKSMVALRLLLLPYFYLSDRLKKGSNITLFCAKRPCSEV